jgi:hypothetical protein
MIKVIWSSLVVSAAVAIAISYALPRYRVVVVAATGVVGMLLFLASLLHKMARLRAFSRQDLAKHRTNAIERTLAATGVIAIALGMAMSLVLRASR